MRFFFEFNDDNARGRQLLKKKLEDFLSIPFWMKRRDTQINRRSISRSRQDLVPKYENFQNFGEKIKKIMIKIFENLKITQGKS